GPMEEVKTTPIPNHQCVNATCERKLDALGNAVITKCPQGCLCVVRGASNIVPANGTCFQLATTKPPMAPGDNKDNKEEESN
uniref:Rhipicephalus appendiculatus RaCI1 n=1 Tax=Rhipicephalus appendiculatus TaxID=34631 RepID=UPI000789C1E4|nr:Chain D, Rhipicephalus appendiculatus RaCI1 [Rhipicephalus appendiculatus]6RQJ_D Chain D, Rhipicephalus appendiculatus RaCI1 [Rhipicephalus pulchellus]